MRLGYHCEAYGPDKVVDGMLAVLAERLDSLTDESPLSKSEVIGLVALVESARDALGFLAPKNCE